ncbi:hypothetical protein [Roseovarius phycicola]|uniref:Uncharacterized protein n=1 Tax=Roseovarius phycicola TaxID=3080976 RepID=A0ABZ2HPC7_9RHOB
MKHFILAYTLVLAALSPNWLPMFNASNNAIQIFTMPPEISVAPLPAPATQTTSAENVM